MAKKEAPKKPEPKAAAKAAPAAAPAKKAAAPAPAAAPAKKAPAKPAAPIGPSAETKGEFVTALKELVKSTALSTKTADEVFDAVFSILSNSLRAHGRFAVPNFGTFNVRERKARDGINPRTKAKIKIAASRVVRFKPTAKFKSTLS